MRLTGFTLETLLLTLANQGVARPHHDGDAGHPWSFATVRS